MSQTDTNAYQFAGYDADGLAIFRTAATTTGYDIPAPPATPRSKASVVIGRIATAVRRIVTLGAAALVIVAATNASPSPSHAHTTVQTVRD